MTKLEMYEIIDDLLAINKKIINSYESMTSSEEKDNLHGVCLNNLRTIVSLSDYIRALPNE